MMAVVCTRFLLSLPISQFRKKKVLSKNPNKPINQIMIESEICKNRKYNNRLGGDENRVGRLAACENWEHGVEDLREAGAEQKLQVPPHLRA